jgi:hypothetical protein
MQSFALPMPHGEQTQSVGVLPMVIPGGPWRTVPELLFEKKGLIPALQQLLISYLKTRKA